MRKMNSLETIAAFLASFSKAVLPRDHAEVSWPAPRNTIFRKGNRILEI